MNTNTTTENVSETVSTESAEFLDMEAVANMSENEQNESTPENTGLQNVGSTLGAVGRLAQTIALLSELNSEEWDFVSKAVDKANKQKAKADAAPVNPFYKRLLATDDDGFVPGSVRVLVTMKDNSFKILQFIDRSALRARNGFTVVRFKDGENVVTLDSREDMPEWVSQIAGLKVTGVKIAK